MAAQGSLERPVAPGPPDSFVVLTGCSGGGKSTLLDALGTRGHAIVPEPGRRIVREEQAGDGAALPWRDLAAFARRAVAMALGDREAAARLRGWVFFDRGLVDAAVALDHATGEGVTPTLGAAHRYHRRVFLAPPWPEIHLRDAERPYGFEEAVAECRRLEAAYAALGYDVVVLPRNSVAERVAFVLEKLSS